MNRTPPLIIAATLLLCTACGNDTGQTGSQTGAATSTSTSAPSTASASPTTETAGADGDPHLFCQTTRRLEAAGQDAFAGLGRDASAADYKAAERSFVLDNAALLDQVVAAAPAPLAPHVTTMLTAMRQRGGLERGQVTQREASQAERHVLAYERRHC